MKLKANCTFVLCVQCLIKYIHIYIGLFNYFVPQGTYVLQDNKFSLLTQLSSGKQYLDQAPKVSMHPLTLHNLMISKV